jgi:hypothetical protein
MPRFIYGTSTMLDRHVWLPVYTEVRDEQE